MSVRPFARLLLAACLALCGARAAAACLDNVVLVHGNTGSPADWDNTVAALKSRGYVAAQLYLPSWGSKTNAAVNDHGAANTGMVKEAMVSAYTSSCTGKIDVIGHSMGVTLAMKAINELGYASRVNSFVGIAGAQWGMNACGVYPYNVATPTCGANGLSIDSPLTKSLRNKRYGAKMFSIKSWYDEVVCIGSCYVYGVHASSIDLQDASLDYVLGHFGLQTQTPGRQGDLLMN